VSPTECPICALQSERVAELEKALRLTLPLFRDGTFPVTADIVERALRSRHVCPVTQQEKCRCCDMTADPSEQATQDPPVIGALHPANVTVTSNAQKNTD
jgi:hypothetical protein